MSALGGALRDFGIALEGEKNSIENFAKEHDFVLVPNELAAVVERVEEENGFVVIPDQRDLANEEAELDPELDEDYVVVDVEQLSTSLGNVDQEDDLDQDFVILPDRKKGFIDNLIARKEEVISVAKFLFNSKASLGVVFSTATTALYAPTAAMFVAGALATSAAVEYLLDQKCDRSLSALGAITTIAGVGLGVPVVHRLAVASVGFAALTIGGMPLVTNSVVSSIIGFMMSASGYMTTNALTFAASYYLSSDRFKNMASEIINENVYDARAGLTDYMHEHIGCLSFIGIPFGSLARRAISPLINSAVDRAVDGAIAGVNNIGGYGQATILSNFQRIGESYINNLSYLPKLAYNAIKEKFADRVMRRDEDLSSFVIV